MDVASPSVGRRERNKQLKLERIVAAASELFAEHGVDDVTTQQIADRADIGTGTLFLYARTKGELLLLVQNAHYAEALERGIADADAADDAVAAVLAILHPVVACNRVHVDNGRTYLREMAFGDAAEPHHAAALEIAARTEAAIAAALARHGIDAQRAEVAAHVVSAIAFVTMASAADPGIGIDAIVDDIAVQVRVLLER